MNMYLPALISVLMFQLVSSECFQLTGSTSCPAFDGSFVSASADFNNVASLDSFVLARVGDANTNKLYIESFQSSYGCSNYTGGGQEHLQTMFCAQLVAGSTSRCQKKIATPLCLSTCQQAIENLVSIFRSTACRLLNATANIAKIQENRAKTVSVYHNLCYRGFITSRSSTTANNSGCIVDAMKPVSGQPTSDVPIPSAITTFQSAPTLAAAELDQSIESSTLPTSEEKPATVPFAAAPPPPNAAASSPINTNQNSTPSPENNSETAVQDKSKAVVDQSKAVVPDPGAEPNQNSDQAMNAGSGAEESSNESPSSDISAPESEGATDNTDESAIEPPAALAPDTELGTDSGDASSSDTSSSDTSSSDTSSSDSGSTDSSSSSDGGSSTGNASTIWAIIGTSIAILVVLLIGVMLYRRKRSKEENPFKGTNSLGSYGSSSNNFVTSNEGIVARAYYPELPDEVALNVGDRVDILEAYDDGWALGDNLNTGARGIFPLQCIEQNSNEHENPPSPSSRVSSLYSIGKFYGKGY